MIEKIISGGQTGADRGALEAAIQLGIPHGGFCPKGRRAEDGMIPAQFELEETKTTDYRERTRKNVEAADGTAVFTAGRATGGSLLTLRLCGQRNHRWMHVITTATTIAQAGKTLREWVDAERILVLNVAGQRESKAPGMQTYVRRTLLAACGDRTCEDMKVP